MEWTCEHEIPVAPFVNPTERQTPVAAISVDEINCSVVIQLSKASQSHHGFIADKRWRADGCFGPRSNCYFRTSGTGFVALERIVGGQRFSCFKEFFSAADLYAIGRGGPKVLDVNSQPQIGFDVSPPRNRLAIFSFFAVHAIEGDANDAQISPELALCGIPRNLDLRFGLVGLPPSFYKSAVGNYSRDDRGAQSDNANPNVGPQCPNLVPPIIAFIALIVAISCVPMLILGTTPFTIVPSVIGIVFGNAAFGVCLIFWLFPPPHCYRSSFAESVSTDRRLSNVLRPRRKNVHVLPIVVPKLKFCNVQRHRGHRGAEKHGAGRKAVLSGDGCATRPRGK